MPALASQSVYGYTKISRGYVNNVTAKIVGRKPAPSIEKNAHIVSEKAKTVIERNKTVTASRKTVSRGAARYHPYEAEIKEVGKAYWPDEANLDALVWISAHECRKPGVYGGAGGKYVGLFQLGNPPVWMIVGDPASETRAGCLYIKSRYGTPLRAKAWKMKRGWY